MGKKVIVIASGETERRSLPHLVDHLVEDGITVVEVRYPPRNLPLNVGTVSNLLKATWYELQYIDPPDKFVVLVDVDGNQPGQVLTPFQRNLVNNLRPQITAPVLFAYAQWHLEAWFFGDAENLRAYLGRDLGNVDASNPDDIENPKLHLKNLMGGSSYTSIASEEIARRLDGRTIAGRSASFRGFLEAVRNGGEGEGSNSHALRHMILSHARLPIPTLPPINSF